MDEFQTGSSPRFEATMFECILFPVDRSTGAASQHCAICSTGSDVCTVCGHGTKAARESETTWCAQPVYLPQRAAGSASDVRAAFTPTIVAGHAFSASLVNTQLRLVLSAETLIRCSGFDVRDTDSRKVAQDGLLTDAEFDPKMPASSLFFAVLDSLFSALTFSTPIRRS